MPEIQIIAKDNHKTLVTTEGTSAKLSEASVVLVKVAASDVLVVNREGTNAVIRLKNGETIVIEGFFSGTAEPKDNSLVFQDENGQLIWAKFKDAENDADADSDADADADSDVEPQALLGEDLPAALPAEAPQELVSDVIYQPISSIEPLLYHDAGVNPWLWAAIPLVTGGIIAAASNHDSNDDSSTPTDTTPPATPSVPSGYLDNVGADQGIKGSGSSTDDTTPGVVISAPGAGETPTLYVDGEKVAASYDPVTGTLTPTTPLADGSHQLTYTLTDAAGNESAQSPAITVTVDTLAPVTPSVPSGYLDNVGPDQGIKGSGSSTDDTTPGVVISAPGAGETPTLYVDGEKVAASYDPVTGTLTPTTPLADGSHQLTYTLTDAAGNESAQSPALTVTVDTLAPTLSISTSDLVLGSGEITTITFEFSEPVIGFVSTDIVTTGGTLSNLIQVDANTWTATFTQSGSAAPSISIANGAYSDAVGNAGIGDVLDGTDGFIFNPAAVDLIGAITIPADVNGDGIINASELGTDGTVDAQVALTGATLGSTVTINGTAYTVTQADLDVGFITAPISVTADGALTITATATDAQGNVDSSSLSVTVDTAAVDAINDNVTFDPGTFVSTIWGAPIIAQDINVLDTSIIGDTSMNVEFSVPRNSADIGTGHEGDVVIQVSQDNLIAVASGFSVLVEYFDGTNWVQYTTATTTNGGLIADALGLGVLGIVDDGKTIAVHLTGVPEGQYRVVVQNDSSAIGDLLDDLTLAQLGDQGILLGADNQDAVLDAVETALNGQVLTLGTLVRNVLEPLLNAANAAGETLAVTDIVAAIVQIPLVGSLLGGVDTVLDFIADALVDNLLTVLEFTNVTINGSETYYTTPELAGNVFADNGSGADDRGNSNAALVTKVDGVDVPTDGTDAVIKGLYGTLYINKDGVYRYVLNGSVDSNGQVDDFTY